ncbi:PepSY domain-containing protein [Shewanella corallii]|uniref:PepSY domain-containing protein n=1 Tax=Shewanella corallii TaxID=560080 RepID=A0ABT0NCL7_9GAMM|nr:PepSY-associated TM helix domain-containing protein [Shewanella corallii]MCL2916199.1 PepSY domain-containing protein [Shewanella corallii]
MSRLWFKWHKLLALLAFLPIILIAVSGSILVFKHQLDSLLMPDKVSISETGQRLNIDTLLLQMKTQLPEYEVGTWELFQDGETADRVYLIKRGSFDWFKVFLNPYTGEALSQPVPLHHYLTDWLLELHHNLLLDTSGLIIGLLSSLIMLYLAISGLVMHRKFWRQLFALKLSKDKRKQYSSIHKLAGVWSAPVLLILSFTGGYWNVLHLLHESEEHSASPYVLQQPLYNQKLSINTLMQQASDTIKGFEPTYLVLAYEPGVPLMIYGRIQINNPFYSDYANMVSFTPDSGELQTHWDVRERAWYFVLDDSFRALHFGTFAGLASKLVWCLLGAMPLVLGFTGLYLWWRKRKSPSKAFNTNPADKINVLSRHTQ